jgi:hypothetical protein
MLEELRVKVTNSPDVPVFDGDRKSTPAWLIRVARAAHAAASLAECCDLCEWFDIGRTRATVHHWYNLSRALRSGLHRRTGSRRRRRKIDSVGSVETLFFRDVLT